MSVHSSGRFAPVAVLRAVLAGGVALPVLIAASASAQTAPAVLSAVIGQVSDKAGTAFLEDATVEIPALGLRTKTDREGRFTIPSVPAGAHDVVVRYIGAADTTASVTVVSGQPARLDIAVETVDSSGAAAGEEEVVVVGSRPIAESESAALQVQRASRSLVAVVSSDAVGRLPDQNIAAAAGRLPGVAVQRDQGQSRYLSLRGGPITWSTLSFDGITVISPEGRDSRYDSIPSAIATQIVVRKAVTPDMTGETVSGNVDVITRSAFDYPGARIATKTGVGYVTLGNGAEYEASAVASDRWKTDSGEFGLVASASYYQREMATDNFETDWEAVAQDLQPGFADRAWARETENKLYRLTRRNYSFTGRADWRPDDDNRFFVSSIYTIFTDDELRNNYIFDMDDRQSDNTVGAAPCVITPNLTPTNTGYGDVCNGNTPFLGTVYGIDINSNYLAREFAQSIFTNTVGGDHTFGNAELVWRLNYTRAEDDRSFPVQLNYDSPSTRTLRPTVFYDLTDPDLARVELYRTIQLAGPTRFQRGERVGQIEDFQRSLVRVRSLDAVDVTEAYTAKADLTYDTDLFGASATLKFGLQYDDRTKTADEYLLDVNGAAAIAALGLPTNSTAVEIQGPFKGELPLGYSFRYFGKDQTIAIVNQARAGGAVNQRVFGNYYDVSERILAGYALAELDYDWGNILGGFRVEHIRNESSAFVVLNAVTTPITVKSERTLVFPSLHINYDIDETKKLRLSFNTGAARPDYDELRPNFVVNDTTFTISGGNPDAKPERTYGVDAYFEWYIEPRGYFMVGVFYKDVRDVLATSTTVFGRDELDTPGTDRSGYVLSTLINAGDGRLFGAEAALQIQLDPFIEDLGLPEWMGGFGIQANVSYNDSEVTLPGGRLVPLPGTSDLVYNVQLYYEKYGFSARLSYQRRTEWLDALGGPDTGGDIYWSSDDELDLSMRYNFDEGVEGYLDWSNILNGPGQRYAGIKARTIEYEKFGSRITAGVRLTF